jgi:hypothetical protein
MSPFDPTATTRAPLAATFVSVSPAPGALAHRADALRREEPAAAVDATQPAASTAAQPHTARLDTPGFSQSVARLRKYVPTASTGHTRRFRHRP